MALILVVDDNPHLRGLLQKVLESAGHEILFAADGATALALVSVQEVALILTDILLPEMDGFTLCQALRRQCDVPIIILSVLDQPETIAQALELGADDYLTKPLDFQVLNAHIDALLRRVAWLKEPLQFPTERNHEIRLCPDKPEVLVRGNIVRLCPVEYKILRYLMMRADHTVRTEILYQAIWGHLPVRKARLVHTNIYRVRQKIEENPHMPCHIVTVNNIGYQFCTNGHHDEHNNQAG